MTVVATDRVPNGPLRAAVEEAVADGLTYSEIARRAGWMSGGGTVGGDTSYLKRLIGLKPWSPNSGGYGPYPPRDYMSYEAAVKLCHALGHDPIDYGL